MALTSYGTCLASLTFAFLTACDSGKKTPDVGGDTTSSSTPSTTSSTSSTSDGSGGTGGSSIIGGEGGEGGAADCPEDAPYVALIEDCASVCREPDGVSITNKSERDEFASRGCEVLIGSLSVSATDVGNLTGLSELRVIDGTLTISSTSLTNANGLNGLEVVTQNVDITSNGQLENIAALAALREVQGGVTIAANAVLGDLAGLQSLVNTESFLVAANPELTSASLPLLEGAATFSIANNQNLVSIEFPALAFLRGALTVSDNASLEELAFVELKRVGGDVNLALNPKLASADFSSLLSVEGGLNVQGNDDLETLMLESLELVGELNITENPSLPQCQVDALDEILMACGTCDANDESASCN